MDIGTLKVRKKRENREGIRGTNVGFPKWENCKVCSQIKRGSWTSKGLLLKANMGIKQRKLQGSSVARGLKTITPDTNISPRQPFPFFKVIQMVLLYDHTIFWHGLKVTKNTALVISDISQLRLSKYQNILVIFFFYYFSYFQE